MVYDVYTTVKIATSAAETSRRINANAIQLFLSSRSLAFVVMDILEPLPEMLHGNQFVLLMTDCYSELTRSVPSSKTMALHIALHFMDIWIIL